MYEPPLSPAIYSHDGLLRRVDATKWEVFSFVNPRDGLILQIWKQTLRAELAWPAEGQEGVLLRE